jgi:DNA-binding SARP family transcriptional activator/tetratricopeptide (TPR) repeat protein
MLEVALFGHLRLSFKGKNVAFVARPKVAPLLAYLLLNRDHPVSRDSVAFALWPDEPEDAARANLRRHLHALREILPQGRVSWLIVDMRTVHWNPAARVRVDVTEFEEFAADPVRLQEALELYDELLPGYDDEWLIAERERLRRLYVQSLWELARRARGRRDGTAASDYLGRILSDDPWREDALRALMAVRCESGDRSSALQLCADFEARLKDEMGVELMPETSALRRAIEQGNPLPAIPLGPAARVTAVPFADLRFEGRDAELARLHELWEHAVAGSGAFALVLGEAGIGKTRLAAEFALQAETGGRILWGTTSSPETVPYQGVTEILRAALGFVESLAIEPFDVAVLSRLIPELRREQRPIAGDEPEVAKLFDIVADVLGQMARERPVLVVLEDLHNAGPASIAMLEHIAQRCAGHPILILATSREEESRSAGALAELRRPLRGRKPIIIPLRRLSDAAVSSIVADSMESGSEANRVAALSGGHPLFLAELVHAAADPQGLPADTLPARLHDVIRERSERLSPAASFLLRAAAVVGASFDLEVIGEVVGWSEGELAAAADELTARHVIRQTATSRSFEYEFAHDLIASAAYELLPERERRRWHRRAARAAERWYASRLTELSAFVARHFELGGEREPAAAYYFEAARAAAAAFANEEALAHARRALQLSPSSQIERFDLLCLVDDVLERIGDRTAQRETLHELDRVARRTGDPERLREALRRRESLLRYLGETSAARKVIAQLLELATESARWEAIALRDEASLLNNSGSQSEAYEIIRRAAERAAAANDPEVLVSTLTLEAYIAAAEGYQAEAATCLRLAKEAAAATGSITLPMRVAYCEMMVLTRFAAWSKVVESGPPLLGLAAKVGSTDVSAAAHAMLGGALGMLFNVEDARHHLREAIELYRSSDTPNLCIAYNDLATIELEVGRVELAERALAGIEEVLARSDSAFGRACASLIACELATQREEHASATELADAAVAAATARGDDLFVGEALRCKGTSLRANGRAPEAIPVLERSLEIFRRLSLPATVARVEAELSLACALAGDSRAASFADQSLRLESDAQAADSPLALWPLAQALQIIGRPAEAQAMLRRAHDAFQARRKRLRGRRDRLAFSEAPMNAALQRAYASACSDPSSGSANGGTLRAPRAPKTRTADRGRLPGRCP